MASSIAPVDRRLAWTLAAVWLCFLLRASFYCAAIPLWEGWDEYAHFDYVRHLALDHNLPARDAPLSGEVAASLRLTPLAWVLKDYFPSVPHLTHDQYWRLPESERASLQRQLAAVATNQALWQENPALSEYEGQHPPAYYALMAVVYQPLRDSPLTDRVWWLRAAGILLASLVVPCTWLLGRAAFGDPARAIGAAAVVAAMPGLMITIARVSNEALAVPVGAALLAAMSAPKRRPLLIGLLLSLALLTKAYFLTAALAIFICLAVEAWQSHSWPARSLLLVAFPTAAIAGWWYLATWRATSSLSGEEHDVAFHRAGFGEFLRAAAAVNWLRVLDSNFNSHVWTGGWSYLGVRAWMYHGFALLALAGIAGTVWIALRPAAARRVNANQPVVRMIIVFLSAFAAGLAYHAVTIYAAHGLSAVNGWYIDNLVSGEAVLWCLGLMLFLPGTSRPYVFPALVVAFLSLDLFAMHAYLLPYYTGFTAHTSGNHLPALHLAQLAEGSWSALFARLAANKPTWLTAPALAALWSAYLLASAATGALAWSITRTMVRSAHRP